MFVVLGMTSWQLKFVYYKDWTWWFSKLLWKTWVLSLIKKMWSQNQINWLHIWLINSWNNTRKKLACQWFYVDLKLGLINTCNF